MLAAFYGLRPQPGTRANASERLRARVEAVTSGLPDLAGRAGHLLPVLVESNYDIWLYISLVQVT